MKSVPDSGARAAIGRPPGAARTRTAASGPASIPIAENAGAVAEATAATTQPALGPAPASDAASQAASVASKAHRKLLAEYQ